MSPPPGISSAARTRGLRRRLGTGPGGRLIGGLLVGLLGSLGVTSVAQAVDRPNEADLFGAPSGKPPATGQAGGSPGSAGSNAASGPGGTVGQDLPSAVPAAPGIPPSPAPTPSPTLAPARSIPAASPTREVGAAAVGRDTDLLGDPSAGPQLSRETAPDDPLKIGGQLYLRANYNNPGSPNYASGDPTVITSGPVTFSAPSLVDAYFDARPNERVRGFVLGRMFFDPTLPSATSTPPPSQTTTDTGMGSSLNPTTPSVSGVSITRGPTVVLDQLWLRFDLLQTVFVTAGRQHVKWGTGRFWTPTDFLHPVHRNPVAVFDARPGFTMLKLHLPWEERGWNFYAFGLVEGFRRWDRSHNAFVTGTDSTPTLGQIGGAARAELVYGSAELGLDLVAYKDQKPKYGVDLSFGIGDFDFYADAGFQYGSEIPRVDSGCPASFVNPGMCIYYSTGLKPQVATGGTYSMKYNDNDVFTLAGEYFYNSRGYSDPRAYLNLFFSGNFEFFYTGRHYAALSAILNAPWSWNYTNFTFSTIGNLSDQSFLSRLDYSHTLLTHLSFEAYGAVDYGRTEGEFRLGADNIMIGGGSYSRRPQAFSLGLGLRIKI